ncbi:MAG TPA: hypothetical protein VL330_04300 [Actinomycetes bacterium]|nr:hypothetical protein [Actinomycetes bacterium]
MRSRVRPATEGAARIIAGLLFVAATSSWGIAVVGIVIVISQVLRRHGERLALGYVIARSIEGVLYGVSAIVCCRSSR